MSFKLNAEQLGLSTDSSQLARPIEFGKELLDLMDGIKQTMTEGDILLAPAIEKFKNTAAKSADAISEAAKILDAINSLIDNASPEALAILDLSDSRKRAYEIVFETAIPKSKKNIQETKKFQQVRYNSIREVYKMVLTLTEMMDTVAFKQMPEIPSDMKGNFGDAPKYVYIVGGRWYSSAWLACEEAGLEYTDENINSLKMEADYSE
jgi:hypothetical protein